jgi:hypothetical protein
MVTTDWRFSALEFSALWEALSLGEPPYPLQVTSPGETEAEHAELCRRTLAELARRLNFGQDWDETAPVVALRTLASSRYWIDSVWVTDARDCRLLRLRAAGNGHRSVLACQLSGNGGAGEGDLVLSVVDESMVVSEVVAALPQEDRGGEPPTSLSVTMFTGGRGRSSAGGGFMRSIGADSDRNARELRTLRGLLDTDHVRGGQIAANVRDRMGRRSRSPIVFWFDNAADGRYLASVRTARGGEDWVTVVPAGQDDLVAALRRSLGDVGVNPDR